MEIVKLKSTNEFKEVLNEKNYFYFVSLCVDGIVLASCRCRSGCRRKGVKKYAADESLNAVLWMHKAAEYKALCFQSYNIARVMMDQALANKEWCADLVQSKQGGYQSLPPAVIVDADETVINNGFYQRQLVLTGESYSSRSWSKWCQQEKASAIAGALEFCKYAQKKGGNDFLRYQSPSLFATSYR